MAKGNALKVPYAQSWMDRFFDWVERLPIPYWLFYLLVYAFIVLSQHMALWFDGSLPTGTFAPLVAVQNIWFVFIAEFWHFARLTGAAAMDKFRPALALPEAEFQNLKYRFTHLSRRTAWMVTLFGAFILWLVLPVLVSYFGPLFFSTYTKISTIIIVLVALPLNFGAFFSVLRMLVSIDGIYGRVKRINLFNLTPLYALSAFTSRMGMVFILFLLLNIFTPYLIPSQASSGVDHVEVFYTIFNSIFAILVFILPLRGIHKRLEAAKERAVEANNDLIEEGFSKIQSLVRSGKHARVPELRNSNSALLEYRQELSKISTWPWDTATLRTFITALAVPMTIWVVQQVLLRTVVK